MTSPISFALAIVCTAFVGIVKADLCSTTYSGIVSECNTFGQQLRAQLIQNGDNEATAADLQPGVLCTTECFSAAKLPEVKAAMSAGCFGDLASSYAHGNATEARGIGQQIDAFFDAVEDAACARNGATYCQTFYLNAAAAAAGPSGPGSSACPILASMGCCLKNAIDQDARIREFNPAMPTGIQMLGFAADCNVTIPSDICPGSGTANFGTGGLSAACLANPIVQTCDNFGEALVQQFARSKAYGTTVTDLSPDTLCTDPCFTHQNLQHLKDAVRDGCFGQSIAAIGGVKGMTPTELHRKLDDFLDALENFACVKNGAGDYCAKYLEAGIRDAASMEQNGGVTRVCNNIQAAGCCGPTMRAQDSAIRALDPNFPNQTAMTAYVAQLCPQVHTMTGAVCPGPNLNFNNIGPSSGGSSGSGDGGLSGGDDAGIVIGVLAFIGIAVFVGLYVVKPQCDNNKDADDIQYESSHEMGYTRMSDDA
jgi:hypothetical protein